MKSYLHKVISIALALLLVSCVSSSGDSSGLPPVSSIRPTVLKEGTIANPTLVKDATNALFSALQVPDLERPSIQVLKFVVQQPVGPTGKKAWREMWILMKNEKAGRQFIVTFREDGSGSADFRFEEID